MVENIIGLLDEKDLDYKELVKQLKLETNILDLLLKNMINNGTIILTNKKKYRLVSKTNLKKGVVLVKKNHETIVKIDNREYFVPLYYINGAMDKDKVLVEIYNERAKIIKIIEKYNPNLVCEVVIKNNKQYAKYNNELIELYGDNLENITSGYMVLMKRDDDFKNAKVLELIGHKDAIDMSIIPYAYEYGFSDKFSEEVLNEIQKLPTFIDEDTIQKEILENGFIDLRNEMIFTIDGSDTKDIDDAISLKENSNGTITLATHIALPSYYIKRDSYIFQDIIIRGTSVYPKGKVIPMNHPKLSNEICSLNEDSDRFAISYFLTFDNKLNCKKVDIKLSIINSKKKMTYENVNKILEENTIPEGYENYSDTLLKMNSLAKKMKNKMQLEGFLDFYSPETKIKIDDNDKISFEKRENRLAEDLIEFFMLTTNEEVTRYLEKRGLKLIYRIDDEPNQMKLCQVMSFLATKYNIKLKEIYNREDIKKILKSLKGTKEEKVFNNILIRCMSRAKFSNINIGHYATGKKVYAMHTSPIRRAEDFIDQCIILDYLKYGVEYANDMWEDDLGQLAEHFTKKELAADKLEQRILKNEKAKYLKNYVGQEFEGIISSVTEFGLYVEIDEMFEGLINISSLGKKMKYIPEIFSYMDKTTKKMYSLGDTIRIKIKQVTDDYQIDFELLGESYDKKEEKGKIKKKTN